MKTMDIPSIVYNRNRNRNRHKKKFIIAVTIIIIFSFLWEQIEDEDNYHPPSRDIIYSKAGSFAFLREN
jgi:hypothetical protein